jgi:hypothetical protein
LLGVWHGKRSKAISTGNKRRIVPHLLSFLILPRSRGNPFQVVQRYETICNSRCRLSQGFGLFGAKSLFLKKQSDQL